MKNRKGIIKISESFIYGEFADLELLKLLGSEVAIINIEIKDFPERERLYYGFSNQFDEIKEGEIAPFYGAVVTDTDGLRSIRFERVR